MRSILAFLCLFLVCSVKAETFTVPAGYLPLWVGVQGGYVVSLRGEAAPTSIDSSEVVDGEWYWVIATEEAAAGYPNVKLGTEGNRRLEYRQLHAEGTVLPEAHMVSAWQDDDLKRDLMAFYYLEAYKWELVRQSASADSTHSAEVKAVLVSKAEDMRDDFSAKGDVIKDELYP